MVAIHQATPAGAGRAEPELHRETDRARCRRPSSTARWPSRLGLRTALDVVIRRCRRVHADGSQASLAEPASRFAPAYSVSKISAPLWEEWSLSYSRVGKTLVMTSRSRMIMRTSSAIRSPRSWSKGQLTGHICHRSDHRQVAVQTDGFADHVGILRRFCPHRCKRLSLCSNPPGRVEHRASAAWW